MNLLSFFEILDVVLPGFATLFSVSVLGRLKFEVFDCFTDISTKNKINKLTTSQVNSNSKWSTMY